MQNTMITGAQSISSHFILTSKMKFPLSILPTSALIGFLTNCLISLVLGFVGAWLNGFPPTIHLLQLIYWFPALICFTLAGALVNSSILIILPDFRFFLNYGFRFFMYGSGVIFSLAQFPSIPNWLIQLQVYNPFYYLIEGFRASIFSTSSGKVRSQWLSSG